jgi:hypothetical protein
MSALRCGACGNNSFSAGIDMQTMLYINRGFDSVKDEYMHRIGLKTIVDKRKGLLNL